MTTRPDAQLESVLISSICLPGARDGGSATAWNLIRALRRQGMAVSACTSDYGSGIRASGDPDVRIFPQTIANPLDVSLGVHRFLSKQIKRASVCHFFSFYATATAWGVYQARRYGVPYVISPMGNTVPERDRAIKTGLGPIKKRLYFELLAKSILSHADLILCVTPMERDRVRRFVPQGRFAVIPPGRENSDDSVEAHALSLPPHSRIAFFLGRLSPEKSIPFLLEVWAGVRKRVPGALLVIAGDDKLHPGYERELRTRASELGIVEAVHFAGTVDRSQKKWLFEQCACLVLPSKNESFGHVVVEALAAARPAITSTGTPWSALPDAGIGRWLSLNRAAWENCLCEYLSADGLATQSEFAQRCCTWVRENIPTWDRSAEEHVGLYRDIIRSRSIG